MPSSFRYSYWLGCCGGMLGVGAAFFAMVVGLEMALADTVDGIVHMGRVLCASIPAIMFSLLGILAVSLKDTLIAGIVMFISGIAVLYLLYPYGCPACLIFFIAGILIIHNR